MRFYDLDIDVKNYAKRIVDAGYKCPADINSVSDFVKGLKILNLWGDGIFWFLRSTQNAGLDTTVYSLSNLGIYDGTLIHTVTWSPVGITFPQLNSTNGMTTNLTFTRLDPKTYGCCAKAEGNVTVPSLIGQFLAAQTALQIPSAVGTGNITDYNGVSNSTYLTSRSFSNFALVQMSHDTSTTANSSFNNNFEQRTILNTNYTHKFELCRAQRNFQGIISFAFYFNKTMTQTQQANFYSLYKSTAGKGLGLP